MYHENKTGNVFLWKTVFVKLMKLVGEAEDRSR